MTSEITGQVTDPKKRWIAALEVFLVFGLVMAQIWILPDWFKWITAALVIIFVLGSCRNRPAGLTCLEYLGFGKWNIIWQKFESGWFRWLNRLGIKKLVIKEVAIDFHQILVLFLWIAVSLLGLLALALAINPGFFRKDDFWDRVWSELQNYLMCWALIQQFAMQSCVANRLEVVCEKKWLAAFVTGSLFAIAHYPNPVLMPGTLILGSVGAYFFLSGRNLYLIAIAHSVLATATKYLIAYDLLKHSMRVGPGFWN